MRTRRFFSALILALAVTAGGAIAKEPDHLPGLVAPPCSAIIGEPAPRSEPAKIYHMLIFYKVGGPICSGPAAKDFAEDPGKTFGTMNLPHFILQTVQGAPVGKTFLVLVGVQRTDPKTDKTYLVPSILTMTKSEGGTLQGFKVITSRDLKKGRFVDTITENDVVNLITAQEFVIFSRAPQEAASKNLNPRFFENIIDPYIAYLTSTVSLECSEGKHTA